MNWTMFFVVLCAVGSFFTLVGAISSNEVGQLSGRATILWVAFSAILCAAAVGLAL